MEHLTLYVRKELTTDKHSIDAGLSKNLDIVAYLDKACTKLVVRWGWFKTTCPRRQQPSTMFNCRRWNLVWLDSDGKELLNPSTHHQEVTSL